jgi:hypothetical protein
LRVRLRRWLRSNLEQQNGDRWVFGKAACDETGGYSALVLRMCRSVTEYAIPSR